MLKYLKKRPMLLCGILGSFLCVIGYYSQITEFFIALGFIFLFFFLKIRRVKTVFLFVVAVLFTISVSVIVKDSSAQKISSLSGNTVSGSFTVESEPEGHGSYYYTELKAKKCEGLKKGTKIAVFTDKAGFECGDIVASELKLKAVKDKYLKSDYADKIYITGSADKIAVIKKQGDGALAAVHKLRLYISKTLFANVGYREAATLTAVAYGDKSYISDDFYGCIRSAGVSHVMVVSGMHLAIIVSLTAGLCEKLFYNAYIKCFAVILTVLGMSALCGFTKSIIRAGFCYVIYAVGLALKRDNTPENTLGGAVSLIYIFSPFTVFSISFQLSALSTLGIVAAAAPVNDAVIKHNLIKNGLVRGLFSSCTVTLSALLFTLPVTVYCFGYISTVSVITNLLISEAVTAALVLTAAGLVIYAVFPLAGRGVMFFAGEAAHYINAVIEYFGSLKYSVLELGNGALPMSVALLLSVTAILFACKKHSDNVRLKKINNKIIREGGGRLIWR